MKSSRKAVSLLELKAVAAIADRRTFRAAAFTLEMSPSALSHAVGELERRLGVRLFHRTTRSVSLTAAGEQFLERIRPALTQIDSAVDGVDTFRGEPAGVLRINASEEAARQMLAPVVAKFLDAHPRAGVDLVTEGRFVDIVAEGFDLGVRAHDSVPRDMIAIPFGGEQRFAVVATPGYFDTRPPPQTPHELMSHRCLRRRLPSGKLYRWEFERADEALDLDVPGPLTLDNDNLMVDAALAGMGVGYLLERRIQSHLAAGRLVRVLDAWTPPFTGLAAYYPRQRNPSPTLQAFLGVLRATAR